MKKVVINNGGRAWHSYLNGKTLDVDSHPRVDSVYIVLDTPHNQSLILSDFYEDVFQGAMFISKHYTLEAQNEELISCLRKEGEL